MNTKLIMTLSALFLFLLGTGLTFFPSEILGYFNMKHTVILQLVFQILGAIYLAFAMLNWIAKGAHIGGIYNKPIAIANFTHFSIVGITFIKSMKNLTDLSIVLIIIISIYIIFAILFGVIFFRNPSVK